MQRSLGRFYLVYGPSRWQPMGILWYGPLAFYVEELIMRELYPELEPFRSEF